MPAAGVWHWKCVFNILNGPEGRGQDTPTTAPSCCSRMPIPKEILTDHRKSKNNATIAQQHQRAHHDFHDIPPHSMRQPTCCVGRVTPPLRSQPPFTHLTAPAECDRHGPRAHELTVGGSFQADGGGVAKDTSGGDTPTTWPAGKVLPTPNLRHQSLHQLMSTLWRLGTPTSQIRLNPTSY